MRTPRSPGSSPLSLLSDRLATVSAEVAAFGADAALTLRSGEATLWFLLASTLAVELLLEMGAQLLFAFLAVVLLGGGMRLRSLLARRSSPAPLAVAGWLVPSRAESGPRPDVAHGPAGPRGPPGASIVSF